MVSFGAGLGSRLRLLAAVWQPPATFFLTYPQGDATVILGIFPGGTE